MAASPDHLMVNLFRLGLNEKVWSLWGLLTYLRDFFRFVPWVCMCPFLICGKLW